MAIDYDKMAQLAKRLIEANGRDLVLRQPSTAVDDSDKPWRGNDPDDTDDGDLEVTVKGVVLGYQDIAQASDLLRRGTKRALVAQLSALDAGDSTPIDLRPFTLLIDGDDAWSIVEVDPLQPGDVCLLYQLHLKE